jgi:DNA polymerase-3 subunit epsilon
VDLAGYNILAFDVEVLAAEFRRVGIRWKEGRVLDSYKIYTKYQQRRLTDAYEFYTGKQLEGAHGALIDARASLEVLLCQPHRHSLPANATELHNVVFEMPKPGYLDPDGILKWINGEACLTLKKHPNRPLREVKALDPQYLQWMLNKGQFSKGVKAIIAAALQGQFPKEQK